MIYLVKPTGDVLGSLNGLKEETCNVKRVLTDMWELSFEVNKYIDEKEFKTSDYYESISEKMQIWLQTDLIDTMFVIDSEPVISNNGIQETKTITAHTLESELQNKFLRLFYINSGNSASKEYLAKDNINSYTQLPDEYVSLVNFNNPELSLLHLALEGTEWSVDGNLKDIEPEMCAKKFTFSVEEQDIYSFLMNTVASTAQVIFFFDRKNRIVSFRSFDNLGIDTGIFIGLRNLAQQIDIKSTSESGLITKYRPTCSENIGVEYVNFGDPYIYNLDYFANTHNEYGDYKYVTESFHNEYVAWIAKRNDNRQQFIDLTKEYNQNLIRIDELMNRLPNDGCSIDYKTFKADELYFSLNAYENALATLITLYKEDYPEKYTSPDVELDEEHLKTTMYWYDYYSYKYQIVPSVLEAMKIWYETDTSGNLTIGGDGKYIVCENGNPAYADNIDIVKPVDSFKYEFGLYGSDELQNKKKAWMECANLLYKDGFITQGTKENPTQYNTPDENGWNSLTSEQKNQFTSITAYKETLNNYLDYMSFHVRKNSITGTECKGIIRQCEDAIELRQQEIDRLQSDSDTLQGKRNALSSSVLPENNFSSDNLKIFRLLVHEANYSNENIVVTSLDDILTKIDIAEELYQDAHNNLAVVSQPQYSFKTTIDNLFALEEFFPLHKDMDIGNFVRLMPDLFSDDFVKLRLISIETNPLMGTPDISIEFSTMTKSLSDISDLTFLFDGNISGGVSRSSGGSSGGTYGKNNAEIQIANNMLNALLKTETFGTQVSDVILDSIRANSGNFKKLIAHSGIFDTLESGEVKVNGECLTDIIKSLNYKPNISGSMLDLADGTFSFGGGKLKFSNEQLNVNGDIVANTLTANKSGTIAGWYFDNTGFYKLDKNGNKQMAIGEDGISAGGTFFLDKNGLFDLAGGALTYDTNGFSINAQNGLTNIDGGCIKTGSIKSNNYNGTEESPLGNTNGSIIQLLDGKFNLGGGKFKWNGEKLEIDGSGKFTGDISASTINGSKIISESNNSKTVIDSGIIDINEKPISVYDNANLDNVNASITVNTEFSDEYGYSYSKMTSNAVIVKQQSFIGQYDDPISSLDYSKSCVTTNDGITISDISGRIYSSFYFNGSCKITASGINGTFFDQDDEQILFYGYELGKYLKCTGAYQQNSFSNLSKRTLYVGSDGLISAASSSARYKQDISPIIEESLNPNRIYDLPVCQFRYNAENGGGDGSQLYVGFIAEDVARHYPCAARWNKNHTEVDTWEISDMFPAVVKLIQNQHEEIEKLKERIEVLEQKIL